MFRVIVKNDVVFSCSKDKLLKAWSITNKELKYEFDNDGHIYDMFIGREGTPLANRIVSISGWGQFCRISDLETGKQVKKISLAGICLSIAVDNAQTMIAIGYAHIVTFIETTNFTEVKEVRLWSGVHSLAFNNRNDCMLAVTKNGEVHAFKF